MHIEISWNFKQGYEICLCLFGFINVIKPREMCRIYFSYSLDDYYASCEGSIYISLTEMLSRDISWFASLPVYIVLQRSASFLWRHAV